MSEVDNQRPWDPFWFGFFRFSLRASRAFPVTALIVRNAEKRPDPPLVRFGKSRPVPGAFLTGVFFGLAMTAFLYTMSGFRDMTGSMWFGLPAGVFTCTR